MSASHAQARDLARSHPRRASEVEAAALERARLRVVPRDRVQASRVPFVGLVSLLLVGGVVGLLMFNTSMQQASFTESALKEQATSLAARQQTLEMETDRLRDPQAVARRAQDLGMVLPAESGYIQLADGKVIGDPTPSLAGNKVPLLAPPPGRPASLDPPDHVVTVNAPAQGASPDAAGNPVGDTAVRSAGPGPEQGMTRQHQSHQSQNTQQSHGSHEHQQNNQQHR